MSSLRKVLLKCGYKRPKYEKVGAGRSHTALTVSILQDRGEAGKQIHRDLLFQIELFDNNLFLNF